MPKITGWEKIREDHWKNNSTLLYIKKDKISSYMLKTHGSGVQMWNIIIQQIGYPAMILRLEPHADDATFTTKDEARKEAVHFMKKNPRG